MTKKYCYFLSIIFILFLATSFCSARQLEVKIPGLPGEPNIIDYRNVLFNFLVGIGVTLAVLALVIGAIQWLTSAGSPEAEGNAKKRIIGSIFGLVLLLSSYLIMKTINPKLVETEVIPGLPITFGVYLTDGTTKTSCPESIDDIPQLLLTGFNKIRYECGGLDPEKKPVLWVRKFPELNLGGWTDANAKVVEMKCDYQVSIADAKSFMLDIERPGLYLYNQSGADATASRSMQILSSQAKMDDMYKKNTKSYRIITGPNKYYGVLFHEEMDFEGKCSAFNYVTEVGKSPPINLTISPSSFDFVQVNTDPITSGDGIILYSRPFGWTAAAKAGYYEIPAEDITLDLANWLLAPPIFKYEGITGLTKEEKEKCKTFADKECQGSIKINGDYLVVLQSTDDYCQTFYTSEKSSNLTISWLLTPKGGRVLKTLFVVPIK